MSVLRCHTYERGERGVFCPFVPKDPTRGAFSPLFSSFSLLSFSLKPKQGENFPLKFLPQDPRLEAIGDLGAPLPSPLGQEGARDLISLPIDFHHLRVVSGASSILAQNSAAFNSAYTIRSMVLA
ncbi:hypothetical protein U9M48_036710 [Paspalum notatum var. saurae]|uniref:Uncharacterized protein n=1 Tax=Paspalum notatum var. saurae TaxID=547442 RepID=A0AAQ3UDL9_PASNO